MSQFTIPTVDLKLEFETIREEVEVAVHRVFERQDFILGPEVAELEHEMACCHDCSEAVGCASGSDALLLALMALGIGPGDGVLVPAFTFFSTASAVARLGAEPIFVDIDPRTFTINPAAVELALQQKRSTAVKAVIPVHLYGQCAEMETLVALATQNGWSIVEDAAQAVLARYRGRAAGSIGRAGCFSFYPTKNLGGAGDGGMITTNDVEMAQRLRLLRNHGSADKCHFSLLGLNSRLDTLQAAVLLVKLRHLDDWTRQRRQRAEYYRQAFAASDLISPDEHYPSAQAPIVLPSQAQEGEHVYHQFAVRAYQRERLSEHLHAHGIGTAIYYPVPLYRQPAFAYLGAPAVCPESDRAAAEVLSLPLYPGLTESQQSYVVQQVLDFFRPTR